MIRIFFLFRFWSKLIILLTTYLDPQAVVRYMGEVVAERGNVKPLIAKQKKCWSRICFFSKSNKRKHGRVEYAKA